MRVPEGCGADDGIRGSDMSTKAVYAEAAPARNFHPEFGYLCPSAQMRRKVRRAAMTLLAGMLIAAGTVLTLVVQLMLQPPGDAGRGESALSAVALLRTDRPAGAADESRSATMARAPMTDQAALSRAQTSCDDPSGAFLAPQCQRGKARKSHMTRAARAARAASYRAATLPTGRAEAGLAAAAQRFAAAPAASAPAPATEPAPAAVATNEAPPSSHERPATPAKKPVKTAHKRAPIRDIASTEPPRATRSPGFDAFGLFHEPSHIGNGAWAMFR
jgi:hypothetical protein